MRSVRLKSRRDKKSAVPLGSSFLAFIVEIYGFAAWPVPFNAMQVELF
jgi:hypothetical protein